MDDNDSVGIQFVRGTSFLSSHFDLKLLFPDDSSHLVGGSLGDAQPHSTHVNVDGVQFDRQRCWLQARSESCQWYGQGLNLSKLYSPHVLPILCPIYSFHIFLNKSPGSLCFSRDEIYFQSFVLFSCHLLFCFAFFSLHICSIVKYRCHFFFEKIQILNLFCFTLCLQTMCFYANQLAYRVLV